MRTDVQQGELIFTFRPFSHPAVLWRGSVKSKEYSVRLRAPGLALKIKSKQPPFQGW